MVIDAKDRFRQEPIKLFADCADVKAILKYADDDRVSGFTTNPALMRKAGITDYATFAKEILEVVGPDKHVSFEVLADDWPTMEEQARKIAQWGKNVWVKIPITNTKGESCLNTVCSLKDVNLNVTAIFTPEQYMGICNYLKDGDIASIFAGRIMDCGLLPKFKAYGNGSVLWASTREVYNYIQAQLYGYQIITMTPELIEKIKFIGRDLTEYSRETVSMFYEDGRGLTL